MKDGKGKLEHLGGNMFGSRREGKGKGEESFRFLAFTDGYTKVEFTKSENTIIYTYVGQKYCLGITLDTYE